MTTLTYSQLEGVWIQAGGQQSLAPLMAAIALAESGGQTNSLNPTDNGGRQSSYGLWQISTGTHTPPDPNWADPVTNAKLAIGKFKSQGLGAWGTYTSGAYKPFLKNGVPPTDVTITNTLGGFPGADTTSSFDAASCAWSTKLPAAGETCILSKTGVRDIVAVLLMATATIVGLAAIIGLAAISLGKSPVGAVKGAIPGVS